MKKILIAAMFGLMLTSCGNNASETNKEEKPMTFLELAESRFSVRRFEKTAVEQEKIDAILRAAQLAPTAKNLQPQKIYVLKSEEAIKKINEVTSRAYQAPLVFVVCYDKNIAWTNPLDNNASSGEMDATIVGTHMMLEAAEQGLGSCWIKWFNPQEVSEAFGIPENEHPDFLLDVGYPIKGAAPTKMHYEKKDIKDFVKEL